MESLRGLRPAGEANEEARHAYRPIFPAKKESWPSTYPVTLAKCVTSSHQSETTIPERLRATNHKRLPHTETNNMHGCR